MQLETQKNVAVYASYFFSFCIGLEYGVIIPTILEYLHILGVQHEAILGIAVAGFWVSHVVSSRLLCRLVESSSRLVRLLLATCSACSVAGGLLYSLGGSAWGVAAARACCGLGSGAFSVLDSDIAGSGLGSELAHLQWRLRLSTALGWAVSPLLSLALSTATLGNLPNAALPGLVSTVLFAVCGALTLVGLCDLGKAIRFCRLRQSLSFAYERFSVSSRSRSYGTVSAPEFDSDSSGSDRCARIYGLWSVHTSSVTSSKQASLGTTSPDHGLVSGGNAALSKSDEILEKAERLMGLPSTSARIQPTPKTPPQDVASTPSEAEYPVPRFRVLNRKAFCYNLEKTHWLGPYFLSAFLFGSIQTLLAPLTLRYFQFGGSENAVAQLVLSAVGLAPCLLARLGHAPRKVLIVSGYLLATLAVASLLMLCPAAEEGSSVNLPSFCVALVSLSLACGLLFASCHEEGARPLWARGAGLVLGPLWAGSTAGLPRLLLGGQLGLVLVAAFTNLF